MTTLLAVAHSSCPQTAPPVSAGTTRISQSLPFMRDSTRAYLAPPIRSNPATSVITVVSRTFPLTAASSGESG